MKRRDILKSSALFLGYAVTGGAAVAVLNGCKADTAETWSPSFFTADQSNLLAELAETIIPTTDTPGAKTALVHRYMDEAIGNLWEAEDQEKFKMALPMVDATANKVGGKPFMELDQEGRNKTMAALAKDYNDGDTDEHIFKVLRDLTVTGYFTSEVGATQALKFEPVPGPYQGCIPESDVGGTWAL